MNKLLRAWIIGSKRSLSQWKLLTSLVLGVILACTIISSSSIYLDALEEIALNLRKKIIEISYISKSHHIGSELSCVDILVSLYCS